MKIAAIQMVSTPRPDANLEAADRLIAQAAADVEGKTELDAVVAYLQALGRHAPRGGQP